MSRRSLALLDSAEHFINEMLQGVLLLKIPAGRTLYSGPQVSRLHRSLTPQVNCGCSDVAAESRPARLRRAFHKRNAPGRFAVENTCRPDPISGPQVSHFLRSLTPLANGGTDMGTSRRSCAQLDFRDNFKAKLLRNSQASIMRKDKTRLHSIFFLIPF